MYSLFDTAFDKFRNGPDARFDSDFHCGRASDRQVNLAKVVVGEMEHDCSLKVFQFLAEGVGEPRESAAVHSDCVILFLNVRR